MASYRKALQPDTGMESARKVIDAIVKGS